MHNWLVHGGSTGLGFDSLQLHGSPTLDNRRVIGQVRKWVAGNDGYPKGVISSDPHYLNPHAEGNVAGGSTL